ncbi:MAG: TRAP transporter large permease subunit, partial [Devosiaceae bacterium]|nr:TRAP transporter large permease subunit [Devosiaceae bacterium MH13]
MTLIVLFGSFFAALIIGVPVAFALGLSSLITVFYLELPPLIVFQRMGAGINVFALMAIPFFIYAGELMLHGKIADRLVTLAGNALGHVRGGLGVVNVATSMLF